MKAKEKFALNKLRGGILICVIILMCKTLAGMSESTKQAVGTQERTTQEKIVQEKIKGPRIELEEEIKEGSPPIQKKLKFFDVKGKIVKEIVLGRKKVPKKFKDPVKNKVWNGYLFFHKTASVSKNQKYAVLNEYSMKVKFNVDDPKEAEEYVKTYGEEAYVGPEIKDIKLTLFDNNGNVLWKKDFPDRWIHYEMLISNNGHVAVFTEKVRTVSDYSESEWRDIIYVFNKKGKKILTFPRKEEYKLGYIASDLPQAISPNGRYLAIYIDKSKQPPFPWKHLTRFYDLKKNTFWDSEERYVIYEISDDGIARVDNAWNKEDKTTEINLKEYFGE